MCLSVSIVPIVMCLRVPIVPIVMCLRVPIAPVAILSVQCKTLLIRINKHTENNSEFVLLNMTVLNCIFFVSGRG